MNDTRRGDMKTQILCVLKLSLLLNSLLFVVPAMADYKPPVTQKPPGEHTKSGGSRGCPEEGISLTTLSPITHMGHTASGRPTFVWFFNNSSNLELNYFEFMLFEFEPNGRPKPVGEPIELPVSKGINKYSLPENHSELAVGKKYLWQVSILCPDVSDVYLIQKAEIMVVEMSSFLKSKLPITTNNSQKALLYAEQGLWYDGLAEALNLAPKGKLGEVGSSLVQSLVQSEEKTGQSNQPEIKQKIESLKTIANQEK